MNCRIRYDRVNDNLLVSRRIFTTANGTQVKAELDTAAKRFSIKNASTGEEIASGGNTKNLSVAKVQTKQALKELGVQFADEDRAERTR